MPRYTMDLDPAFDRTLTQLAQSKGVSKSEIIKRAVASYSFLNQRAGGDPDHKVVRVVNDEGKETEILLP